MQACEGLQRVRVCFLKCLFGDAEFRLSLQCFPVTIPRVESHIVGRRVSPEERCLLLIAKSELTEKPWGVYLPGYKTGTENSIC